MDHQRMTQVVYRFEPGLYRCFRAACLRRNVAPNVVIAVLMAQQMEAWGEPTALLLPTAEALPGEERE